MTSILMNGYVVFSGSAWSSWTSRSPGNYRYLRRHPLIHLFSFIEYSMHSEFSRPNYERIELSLVITFFCSQWDYIYNYSLAERRE